ncbi:NPCBM/NEW2 domain-containing protein [Streptomyces sp. DvalAA-19]|uniref:NPCBM/NEW2 domain-containing protein n=1 Tax=Streptomyces sp. DvalAA-19 TaxID=1839761 RepID=UPI00114CEBF8|nr:NPCBM/NEW2 domain-containing protein [Streptomyces sp. DvalAA-19]
MSASRELSTDGKWSAVIGIIGIVLTVLFFALDNEDDKPTQEPSSPPTTRASSSTETSSGNPEPSRSPEPQEKFLSDMEPLGNQFVVGESKSINGTDYPNTISLPVSGNCSADIKPSFVEYNLGRKWRTFNATMGLDDESMTDARVQLDIYLDGRRASVGYIAEPNHSREVKDLDVTGVARIKFREMYVGGVDRYCQVANASWGNARLSQ